MYQCKLKIDGKDRKLSLRDGINLKDLAELLTKLVSCLESDSAKFTLVDIKEESYTPALETESEVSVEKFNEVHTKLTSTPYKELPKSYKEYAHALNTILFERGLYIRAQNSIDDTSIEVSSIEFDKQAFTYYSITTIKGKIIAINGRTENKPFINFQTAGNRVYKIFVNHNQEGKLGAYYKEQNLKLRVKLKANSETLDKTEGSLLDFTPPSNVSFLEAINKTKREFGDLFEGIYDSASQLRALRNQ